MPSKHTQVVIVVVVVARHGPHTWGPELHSCS
jgi:hypothetical protein